MSELNLKFFKGQFDFYQSKGLSIYLFKHLKKSYGTHSYMVEDMYALEPSKINDSRFNIYTEKKQLDKDTFNGYAQSSYGVIPKIFSDVSEDTSLAFEYFIQFLKTNPKDATALLKDQYTFSHTRFKDQFTSILDAFDNAKVMDIIHKYPIKVLNLSSNPDMLDSYLVGRGFSDDNLLNFWHKFLFPRKIQLKEPKSALVYKDFLLKKFDRNVEKLKIFFPYFSHLQDVFENIDINVLENKNLTTTTLLLNTKKMVISFCISNWDEDKYNEYLKKFTKGFAAYHKIKESEFLNTNKAKKLVRLVFSHSNPKVNESVLEKTIIDFFKSLQNNSIADFNPQQFNLWFTQNELENKLPEKDETQSRVKNKI